MSADLKMKQEKQDENVSSIDPQGTVFYDNLSEFDILVSAFLRCCTLTLIAPKVLISSGRVRIISPALNFLLNWI